MNESKREDQDELRDRLANDIAFLIVQAHRCGLGRQRTRSDRGEQQSMQNHKKIGGELGAHHVLTKEEVGGEQC